MPLRNGLAGEQIIGAAQGETLPLKLIVMCWSLLVVAAAMRARLLGRQGCCSVAVRGQDVGERWAAALVLTRAMRRSGVLFLALVAAGNLLDEIDDTASQF